MSVPPETQRELAQIFTPGLKGEAWFDATQRWLYSTDASIYQIQPAGVVAPKNLEDLELTLQRVRQHQLSLVPRGGGTSLGGQAVGPGIQLDLGKHLNQILEINLEAGWVRVQPGVILDQLNMALAPAGMWFGPDVAPSNRATLGGMIGNNAAGARSVVYGKTLDHVLELDLLLADGSRAQARELDARSWAVKCRQQSLEGQIYRKLTAAVETHKAEIEARFPKILRRVSGYNLDAFLEPGSHNLAHLITGSEGTLALIREARLKIVPKPAHRGLLVLYFEQVAEALEASHAMLETQPSAAELIDEMLLELTQNHPGFASQLGFMTYPAKVLLLVEYQAHSAAELKGQLEAAERFARSQRLARELSVATEPALQAQIWAIRKAGLPLLYSRPGDYKPVTFVEDTAVAPAQLQSFIRDFDELVKAHDTRAAYYAHASVGCLHIRPLLDLKQVSEVQKMRSLAEAVVELVSRYHGALSGEHGDGLARSEFNPRLFGPVVYDLFCQLKQTCDPQNLLNPGKITAAPPMDQNLRYGQGYQPMPPASVFQSPPERQFQTLVELCNGCGGCRKLETGTMCPPYRVTRDEADSTRGRANALRRLLLKPELSGQDQQELYQVMSLCIGCKACQSECPSKVDMARLKSEFLHGYQQRHGVPLRSRLLGNVKWLNHLGSLTAPLSNQLLRLAPVRQLLERSLGLSAQTPLPPFAALPFEQWLKQQPPQPDTGPAVLLFNDCYMNYNHPEVGRATLRLLRAFGYRVIVPPQLCCGRPQLSLGQLHEARQAATRVWQQYAPWLQQGLQVVGCEPSCVLSFRDEYRDLLPSSAQPLQQQSRSLQEWLVEQAANRDVLPFGALKKEIFYHEHCHQKAQVGTDPLLQALQLAPGFKTQLSTAGCCGMAGSFGYEAEHAELSQRIGAERLLPEAQARPQAELGASGMSCRHQLQQGTGRRVRHLAELLAEALLELN